MIIENKWSKIVQSLHRKYSASFPLLDEFEKQFTKFGTSYLETAKKIARLDLKKLTDKDLKRLYIKYQHQLLRYCVFVWAGFILNNFVAGKAKQILERHIKKSGKQKKKFEIQASLFRPIKKAAVIQLQEEIEKLRGDLQPQVFRDLYLKYRWLSCLDIHNMPLTKKAFRAYIKSFKVGEKKRYISIKKILGELQVGKKDQVYLEMVSRFAYIMDARDDFRRQAIFYAQKLFSEIAERMNLKLENVSYLQEGEIISFLQDGKKVLYRVIKERQKGFFLYYDEKKNIVCKQGRLAAQAFKALGVDVRQKVIQAIRGIVACRGKARGRVSIVKGVRNLRRVKNGDIMVAITTHPDYVPAMRRASAIVTDEGGVTCHAAIVSRELGIPCIVGTRTATEVLKDGDLVEVDAKKGVVRRLEK